MTMREINNYARGADKARRAEMATMLWAAHCAAGFNAYAFAGKRLPKIDGRIRKIIGGSLAKIDRRGEVASVIAKMNAIAQKAGLPAPRPRARKQKGE